LVKETFDSDYKAGEFLNIILSERKKLNESLLKREKYNLIKAINERFNATDFFKYRVNDYKSLASIYKLFENTESVSPKEWVDCKTVILENVTKKVKSLKEVTTDEYTKESKDVRLLAYKFLVDKFNDKYKVLTTEQKSVLRNYINNIDNSDNLKRFILRETNKLKNEFSKIKVSDKVYSIKLKEVIGLMKHKLWDFYVIISC
jgi:transketolase